MGTIALFFLLLFVGLNFSLSRDNVFQNNIDGNMKQAMGILPRKPLHK